MKSIQLFIRLSRLIYTLIASMLYLLGGGIAHYLIGQINWQVFILGFIWINLLLLGFNYLNEYFDQDPVSDDPPWWRTPFSGNSGAIGPGKLSRQVALWAGLTCLTVTASLTVLLFQANVLGSTAMIMTGVLVLSELAFIFPPLRLVGSGYGEVVMSIMHVGLIPALAFTLLHPELHRLLVLVSFPLVTLHLGMLLALELPSYASDTKYEKKSIFVRIGWQRGMLLHNLLLLGSFVIFGLAFVFGLPLTIGWSIIFVLPITIFQVWTMNRIADGARPNWTLLTFVALAIFLMAAYLLTFTFWTH